MKRVRAFNAVVGVCLEEVGEKKQKWRSVTTTITSISWKSSQHSVESRHTSTYMQKMFFAWDPWG